MRCMLIALPFWLWGAVFGLTVGLPHTAPACQEEEVVPPPAPAVQDPSFKKWIVIFDYPSDPILNLRVIVFAPTEGAATVKALVGLFKSFHNTLDFDKLRFVEVAPKKE